MLSSRCVRGEGFAGYAGGLANFIKDKRLCKGQWRVTITAEKVLWTGGNTLKIDGISQFDRIRFQEPLAVAAFEGGASNCYTLITDGNGNSRCSSIVVGDYDDVVAVWLTHIKKGGGMCMYYYSKQPNGDDRVRCYLDIDRVREVGADDDIVEPLMDAIRLVDDSLIKHGAKSPIKKSIIYNRRVTPTGSEKISFHVTWQDYAFITTEALGEFLRGVFIEYPSLYDNKVYGARQLMRCPLSKKKGEFASGMKEVIIVDGVLVDYGLSSDEDRIRIFKEMDINVRGEVTTIDISRESRAVRATSSVISNAPHPEVESRSTMGSVSILEFWRPLMWHLIMLIQQHRRSIKARIPTALPGGGIPVKESIKWAPVEFTNRRGCFKVVVIGDEFCQYDIPNCYHSSGSKTAIQLDFVSGTYHQLCYACNPSGTDLIRYSMFDGTTSDPIKFSLYDGRSSFLELHEKHGITTFLRWVEDRVRYNANADEYMFVLDPELAIWTVGPAAVQELISLRSEYRNKYQLYVRESTRPRYESQMSAATTTKDRTSIENGWKKAWRVDPLKDVDGDKLMKDCMQNMKWAFRGSPRTTRMDIYPHLIPMNNGMMYNVFTGLSEKRTSAMLCTSMMNVHIKDVGVDEKGIEDDDDCRDIRQWYLEVSCGRPDLARYMARLMGYCFTHLVGDRHFYINLGKGSNGKGLQVSFLFCLFVC